MTAATRKPGGVEPPMDLSSLVASVTAKPGRVVVGDDATLQAPAAKTEPAKPAARQPAPKKNPKVAKVPEGKGAEPNPVYPWKGADERIVVGYNVRMRQPLHEKIRWIVENAPGKRSIQTLAVAAIEAECDRILKDMGIEP